MKKNKTLSVILTQTQYNKLEKLADADDRSVSSTVRLLVNSLLEGDIKIDTTVKQTKKK